MLTGYFGKLGVGKTFGAVLRAYSNYYSGNDTVYSNLEVNFDHEPIKSIEDFLELKDGTVLGDELWALADNRKRALMSELATIFCLRSRKRNLKILYTQQMLQIDVRIAYVTDEWIKPKCFPFSKDPLIKYDPVYMIQERWNSDLEKLQSFTIRNLKNYYCLYDTNKDPYFVANLVEAKMIKKIKQELKDRLTEEEITEYNKIINNKKIKIPELHTKQKPVKKKVFKIGF